MPNTALSWAPHCPARGIDSPALTEATASPFPWVQIHDVAAAAVDASPHPEGSEEVFLPLGVELAKWILNYGLHLGF